MKIALIGYGKMGRMTEAAALEKGHQIVSKIAPKEVHRTITADSVRDADICIDFSHPACVIDNISQAASCGKSLVIGTTGWYEQIPLAKQIVLQHKVGLIYSPNFSLGVQLFLKMIEHAAALINFHEFYDAGGYEAHHRQKLDAPSGTAQSIVEILLKQIKRKRAIDFPSLRCGTLPGTHAVLFDSPADTIELKHTARNRTGFAYGAVAAAEWLHGKKGFYTMDALLEAYG